MGKKSIRHEQLKEFAYLLEIMRKRLYLLNNLLASNDYNHDTVQLASYEAFQQSCRLAEDLAKRVLKEERSRAKHVFNALKERKIISYEEKEGVERARSVSKKLAKDFALLKSDSVRKTLRAHLPALLAIASSYDAWAREKLKKVRSNI